ncbi:complement factor B-like [Clupea harengus]|uniref:C3/C5 convertase n=1 Tax=Clupea harengus TaxID=7950 RepID=A0A6P8EZL3_CLUHA|nr:complement factor B-like [Clupea harengus]
MAQTACWTLLTLMTVSSFAPGALSQQTCSDKLLSIKGGSFTLSRGFELGTLLAYKCQDGYYSPVQSRRCLSSGRWKPLPDHGLECKMVKCPDPMVFKHGYVLPPQGRYYVNDTTTYECFSDYKLYGSATRVCKANGKWSGRTPICSRNTDHCPDPGVPAGARRDGHIFKIGDKVTYRCEDGLMLVGSKQRTCKESGDWTGNEPECHFDYTFDTPEEVSEAFGSALKNSLKTADEESPNQQQGKKIHLDKGGNINIFIAIDASDSIDKDHIQKSIDITKNLIEKISYYDVTPNYDIMFFATKVTPVVDIKNYYIGNPKSLADVMKDLDKFNFDDSGDDSGTNLGAAFTKILEHMSFIKARKQEQFLNSSHVIIMFTDGEANMGQDPKRPVSQIKDFVYGNNKEQRMEKLDIYMFGLGPDVERELLTEYVTDNAGKHVFLMDDLEQLHEVFDQMIDESSNVGLCGLHRHYSYGNKETASKHRQQQPWLAEISVRHEDGLPSSCLGSLVTPRFILTAAHCFKFGDTSDGISVIIEDGKTKEHKVERYIPHPDYNILAKKDKGIPEFFDFDVALIELKEDVAISATARPICIPCTKETSGALKLTGADVKCKDHERLLLNNEYEDAYIMSPKREKKFTKIKLGNARDACIEDAKKAKDITATDAKEIVTKNFLCTGGIAPVTDHVACKGDSGGALFTDKSHRTVQVGVVSWGVEDICKGQTVVLSHEHTRDYHINLFKVQPFLKEHLGNRTAKYAPLTFLE